MDRGTREERDSDLRDRIEAIQVEFPRAGYRMVRGYLLRQGERVNGKRIRRVMREYGLVAQVRRRFICTTRSNHGRPIYLNLLMNRSVTGLNQVWIADLTYIRIRIGFVFLAVLLDLFSRKVIGWAISKRLEHELALGALESALAERKPPAGLIHHSDRGVQYASKAYVDLLHEHGVQISMSRAGNPYDNAYCESFIKTLKVEEVYLCNYESYLDVIERVPFFIDEVYNRKRLHSALGYIPPEEFERNLLTGVQQPMVGQPPRIL